MNGRFIDFSIFFKVRNPDWHIHFHVIQTGSIINLIRVIALLEFIRRDSCSNSRSTVSSLELVLACNCIHDWAFANAKGPNYNDILCLRWAFHFCLFLKLRIKNQGIFDLRINDYLWKYPNLLNNAKII